MKTHNGFLLGVIAAVLFAFTPLASAGSHGGGGGHGGGAHFSGSAGGFHGGGFNRAGSFNRGANFNGARFGPGGSLARPGNFTPTGNVAHNGNFHHGGDHSHNGNCHHHHHGSTVVFYDPFYYGWGFPYYGYDYGYGYAGYEAYPADYYQGGYGDGNYSLEMDLQSTLADRGYYHGAIDGVIGNGTRRAVRAFQRDMGLPATGRIDSRLMRALRAS